MPRLRPAPAALLPLLASACAGAPPADDGAGAADPAGGRDAPLPGPTVEAPPADEPPAALPVGPTDAFTASGNEPFWSLRIAPGELALSRLDEDDVDADDPKVVRLDDGGRRYLALDEGIVVESTPEICRDDMSGMPHPYAVTVAFGDTRLEGCGGDPSSLLEGRWTVVDVAGEAAPAGDAAPTFAFDTGAGTVAGSTGCNRFQGGFERTGEGLSFGPLATTRRACPGPAAAVERRFLAVVADVVRFDVEDDGALRLTTVDERAVVARRPPAP